MERIILMQYRCSAIAIGCLALTLPSAAAWGQYPKARPGQFEVHGFDFRPDGAWRKRAEMIRANRERLLRAGAFSVLNSGAGGALRLTGSYFVPVLPIAFKNFSSPFPVSQYQDVLFNPAPTTRPYSVKTFYEQLSNGNISINGVVQNWVTADSNDAYYEDGCNGIGVLNPCPHGGQRFGQLLIEALQKNDTGTFDWGQFDNDGPDGIPNSGDDDGYVDFVTFLQPEIDGACKNNPDIWAHRFVMSAWNGGSPYVTKTPWANHPGQFIKVEDYTMQSGQGGNDACTSGQIMPIGTVAHETGHAFGLPDLYDTDLNNPNHTEGIGEWGLMGSGNYALPHSPARYEAWSLTDLGWVTIDTLNSSRPVTLDPVTSSDTVLYVGTPGGNEYFLIENRQALESDSAQMNPANYIGKTTRFVKSPGLLVWHIDQNQINQHGFRFGDNRVNVGPVQGVALLQADGLNQLRTPGASNRGDAGDSYPGSSANHKISAMTNPATMDNHGNFAGFSLDSILQLPGGAMSFRFLKRPRSVIAAATAGASIKVNGAAYPRFDDIVAPGDLLALDADTVFLGSGGRSRFRFLTWSDGQPRTHTVIAGSIPDTITASFASEFQVMVTETGGGTVSANVAGNFATGIFLPAQSSVTLTAATPSGLVFSGWSGDTASISPILTLTVARPYSETANFVTAVSVVLTDAVDDLLGTPKLTTLQRDFLDQIGNKNGSYDVGDFLAYLQLTGLNPGAPAMLRILSRPIAPKAGADGTRR